MFHTHVIHSILCLVPLCPDSYWKVDQFLPPVQFVYWHELMSHLFQFILSFHPCLSQQADVFISSPIVSGISSISLFTDLQLAVAIVTLLLCLLSETLLISRLMFSLCTPMFFVQFFLPQPLLSQNDFLNPSFFIQLISVLENASSFLCPLNF